VKQHVAFVVAVWSSRPAKAHAQDI